MCYDFLTINFFPVIGSLFLFIFISRLKQPDFASKETLSLLYRRGIGKNTVFCTVAASEKNTVFCTVAASEKITVFCTVAASEKSPSSVPPQHRKDLRKDPQSFIHFIFGIKLRETESDGGRHLLLSSSDRSQRR